MGQTRTSAAHSIIGETSQKIQSSLPLCQVFIPCERDCDLTHKCMLNRSGRSHKSADAGLKDLPQHLDDNNGIISP
jgi:hypothetical protein